MSIVEKLCRLRSSDMHIFNTLGLSRETEQGVPISMSISTHIHSTDFFIDIPIHIDYKYIPVSI